MESKLNNFVPAQLLRLWINQEKDLVRELVALSQIVKSPWQQRLLQLLERHFRRIGDYSQVRPVPILIVFLSLIERLLSRRWNPLKQRLPSSGQVLRKTNQLCSKTL